MHTCDNPECTNPGHLKAGSQAENMRHVSERKRNPASLKTHCVHGHQYTPENTVIDKSGRRRCRTCKNEEARRRYKGARGSKFGTVARAEKTHCPHGHEFSEENTYLNPNGSKECVICRRDRMKRFKERQNQKARGGT